MSGDSTSSEAIPTSEIISNLQAYADQALERHDIPAISLAVWKDNTLHKAAAGCLNLNTGVSATPDAIFQIGSITKVMTASLVMQLVDEGRVELDVPVKEYVRDFLIADTEATQNITVRQLLCHTNGIAGDFFPDDHGHEGNLVARYIDRCNLLPLVHPPGKMYSYSNSAFAIAGRLVEILRGISWYHAMDEYIYQPLGMTQAIANPNDVLRHRYTMGHVYDGNNTDQWVLPEQAYLTMGLAPAGTTPTMSAENLIRFARAHMEGGKSQDGKQWLSPESVAQMQSAQIEVPRGSQIVRKYAGLGWGFSKYTRQNNLKVVGHGGGTNGFLSMLQMIPEQNAVFVLMINGYRPSAIESLTSDLLGAIGNLDLTQPEPNSDATVAELNKIVGTYESFDTIITVEEKDQKLTANIVYKIDPLPPLDLELQHMEDGCFAPYTLAGKRAPSMVFQQYDAAGNPQYLFNGGRQNRRI